MTTARSSSGFSRNVGNDGAESATSDVGFVRIGIRRGITRANLIKRGLRCSLAERLGRVSSEYAGVLVGNARGLSLLKS